MAALFAAQPMPMPIDEFDAFYQQFDSEQLLKEHGPRLAKEARETLAKVPDAKIAGMVVTPDSPEAKPLRDALGKATGQPLPDGMLVGLAPREMVEAVLVQNVGTDHWQEEPGTRQSVLPVVVSTRDGFRFGFFGLDAKA